MKDFLIPPRIFLPAMIFWLFLSSGSPVFDFFNESSAVMETERVTLPPPQLDGTVSLEDALKNRRSVRSYLDEPLELASVSQILWAAQGITLESRGYRTAPSAGATFPMEIYLVSGNISGLPAGLYRYSPGNHTLVKTADGDIRSQVAGAAMGQSQVRNAPALVIVAADYERTAQRYGERAVRYVNMEAGHVGQNIALQAVSQGLGTVMVGAFDDEQVKSVLQLPGNEDPLYIIPVGKPD